MREYGKSLKVHWDNYSVVETAKEERILEGALKREIEIAKEMKA